MTLISLFWDQLLLHCVILSVSLLTCAVSVDTKPIYAKKMKKVAVEAPTPKKDTPNPAPTSTAVTQSSFPTTAVISVLVLVIALLLLSLK